LESYKEENYHKAIDEELIPLNNQLIKNLLDGNGKEFFRLLDQLSVFQLRYFDKMIPPIIRKQWDVGIKTGLFSLKLCGSGGGGFMLGFTQNYQEAKKVFRAQGFELIPVYKNS